MLKSPLFPKLHLTIFNLLLAEEQSWLSITAVYMESEGEQVFAGQVSRSPGANARKPSFTACQQLNSITPTPTARSTARFQFPVLDRTLNWRAWTGSGSEYVFPLPATRFRLPHTVYSVDGRAQVRDRIIIPEQGGVG